MYRHACSQGHNLAAYCQNIIRTRESATPLVCSAGQPPPMPFPRTAALGGAQMIMEGGYQDVSLSSWLLPHRLAESGR